MPGLKAHMSLFWDEVSNNQLCSPLFVLLGGVMNATQAASRLVVIIMKYVSNGTDGLVINMAFDRDYGFIYLKNFT